MKKKINISSTGRGLKSLRKAIVAGDRIVAHLGKGENRDRAMAKFNGLMKRIDFPVEVYIDEDSDELELEYQMWGALAGLVLGAIASYATGQWYYLPELVIAGAAIGKACAGIKFRIINYTDGSSAVEFQPA